MGPNKIKNLHATITILALVEFAIYEVRFKFEYTKSKYKWVCAPSTSLLFLSPQQHH